NAANVPAPIARFPISMESTLLSCGHMPAATTIGVVIHAVKKLSGSRPPRYRRAPATLLSTSTRRERGWRRNERGLQRPARRRRRSVGAAKIAKGTRLPRTRREQQARAVTLAERHRDIFAMQFREVAREILELLHQLGRRAARKHSAHEQEQLVASVKAAAEELG